MILNIFSLTIAITKRERENLHSQEKAFHDEHSKKIFEESRKKVENYSRLRQY